MTEPTLPFELSKGVTATRKGLYVSHDLKWILEAIAPSISGAHRTGYTIFMTPPSRRRDSSPSAPMALLVTRDSGGLHLQARLAGFASS